MGAETWDKETDRRYWDAGELEESVRVVEWQLRIKIDGSAPLLLLQCTVSWSASCYSGSCKFTFGSGFALPIVLKVLIATGVRFHTPLKTSPLQQPRRSLVKRGCKCNQ
jgi:hypothetical protein